MKKLFFLFLFCCFCITAQARKVTVCVYFADDGRELYEDDNVSLVLRTKYNKPYLIITNKTNHTLYVDKGNSFAIRNGEPTCLFSNSSHSISTSTGRGASVNLGSIAGAFGVGGVVGSALQGVNVGGSNSVGNITTTYEQRVLVLAPESSYELHTWDGSDLYGLIPNYLVKPRKIGRTWEYAPNSSVLRLQGVVTYATDEAFADTRQIGVQNYVRYIVYDHHRYPTSPHQVPYKGKNMYSYYDESPAEGFKLCGYILGGCVVVTGIALSF